MTNRILYFAVALLMLSITVSRADEFTLNERAEINKMIASIESQCIGVMTGIANKTDHNAPEFMKRLMGEMNQPKKHCACVAQGFQTQVTPAMVRTGDPAVAQNLLKSVAEDCAVIQFKSSLPTFCAGMFAELAGKNESAKTNSFCGCIQKKVQPLKGAQLSSFTRKTIMEYQEYKLNPGAMPGAGSESLLGYFMSCGFEDLKSSKTNRKSMGSGSIDFK